MFGLFNNNSTLVHDIGLHETITAERDLLIQVVGKNMDDEKTRMDTEQAADSNHDIENQNSPTELY